MNLILFDPAETGAQLARSDPRAVHLLDVLRRRKGDSFDAGIINGPRGKGRLVAIDTRTITLEFSWRSEPPAIEFEPITLILGLPRPQTARDILRDATSLGVAAMHFVTTEKCDANYAHSNLWRRDEWRRQLITGAEQAFCTQLPEVFHGHALAETIATLPADGARVALDNYESPAPLSQTEIPGPRVILAVGPERGWSTAERALLRAQTFRFAHLGTRVLRTETACTAAIALVRAKLGLI